MVVEYANYLHAAGHDVTIYANVVKTVFDVKAKIKVISLFKGKWASLIRAVTLAGDFDVIITDIIVMAALCSINNRGKVLYFAQDYDESYYAGSLMKSLIRALYFLCLRIWRVPSVAVSEHLGTLLRRRFKAAVRVVTNGVDDEMFYPDAGSGYLQLKGAAKVVLVLARSDYRKGFDVALKVLKRFAEEIEADKIKVWAVGERVESGIKMHNFGYVPPRLMQKIMSTADVLLYPTRHEGLPLFVLEAMACGLGVVATEASTILTNMKDSLVCPVEGVDCLYEGLKKLIIDDNLRETLRAGANNTVKKYSLKNSKKGFENALLEIFNG